MKNLGAKLCSAKLTFAYVHENDCYGAHIIWYSHSLQQINAIRINVNNNVLTTWRACTQEIPQKASPVPSKH
jgi:hypothetical protein